MHVPGLRRSAADSGISFTENLPPPPRHCSTSHSYINECPMPGDLSSDADYIQMTGPHCESFICNHITGLLLAFSMLVWHKVTGLSEEFSFSERCRVGRTAFPEDESLQDGHRRFHSHGQQEGENGRHHDVPRHPLKLQETTHTRTKSVFEQKGN